MRFYSKSFREIINSWDYQMQIEYYDNTLFAIELLQQFQFKVRSILLAFPFTYITSIRDFLRV